MSAHDDYLDPDRWLNDGGHYDPDTILAELKKRDGRNAQCWPICSFGWKDADLDPGGCTGISDIEWYEEHCVVYIGGHKTVPGNDVCFADDDASDARLEQYLDEAQEIVCGCGYPGEWDGDSWILTFTDHVRVDLVYVPQRSRTKTRRISSPATAHEIHERATAACEPYEKEMILVSEATERAAGWL